MLPDVQTRPPDIRLSLSRVGVSRVRKLLEIPREKKRPIILLADFKCFVDLPSFQKGTHMSRNLEAINELLGEIVKKPVYHLEALCEDIVREVLKRHEYASRCEVEMESDLMMMRKTPSNRRQQEFVKLIARATAYRGDPVKVEKEVGAEIRGIVLHPHKDKTSPGCSQRATASLIVQVPDVYGVRIEDIVKILEASMSGKAYSYLTEEEEKCAVREACSTPKYVDEVVEDILKKTAERFDLPAEMRVSARCVAEETLFTYNSYAERKTTFGKLGS
jgi:GTP cyclohydrolase-4